MNIVKKNDYLFKSISSIKGVGKRISSYLKNKKIEKINDLLWNLPYSYTDRREFVNLDKLEIGKIFTIKIKVIKYNFPRIRNLPNKISCEDEKGKIDLVYFNSREGYIRKILPINKWVIVSGKVSLYKNKYQITNPDYVTSTDNIDYVKKLIPKYSLTEGIKDKSYRRIIEEVLRNLPEIKDWHDRSFLRKMNFLDWKTSIQKLHQENFEEGINSNIYRRLAYDEIFSHLLTMSENRKKIKRYKKTPKNFKNTISNDVTKNLNFIHGTEMEGDDR